MKPIPGYIDNGQKLNGIKWYAINENLLNDIQCKLPSNLGSNLGTGSFDSISIPLELNLKPDI